MALNCKVSVKAKYVGHSVKHHVDFVKQPILLFQGKSFIFNNIIQYILATKTILCDNEKSLNSNTIRSCLRDYFNIVNAVPLQSQLERFHSTIEEITRYLILDKGVEDASDLILLATIEDKSYE